MTSKSIQNAIVVQVCHIAGLHEHGPVVQIVEFKVAGRADAHQVHTIVATSCENVLVAIVVHIANTGPPLICGADLAIVNFIETGRGLIQDIDIVSLVKQHKVIQSIIVDIYEADRPAAIESITEQVGREGEGLRLCDAVNQHHCREGEKAGLVHPFGFCKPTRYAHAEA